MSQEQEERFGKRVSEIIDANREALSLLADDEPADLAWQYAFDLEARLKEALEARERAEGERDEVQRRRNDAEFAKDAALASAKVMERALRGLLAAGVDDFDAREWVEAVAEARSVLSDPVPASPGRCPTCGNERDAFRPQQLTEGGAKPCTDRFHVPAAIAPPTVPVVPDTERTEE